VVQNLKDHSSFLLETIPGELSLKTYCFYVYFVCGAF